MKERIPSPAAICPAVRTPTFVRSFEEAVRLVGEPEAYIHRDLIGISRVGIWLVPHPEFHTEPHEPRKIVWDKPKEDWSFLYPIDRKKLDALMVPAFTHGGACDQLPWYGEKEMNLRDYRLDLPDGVSGKWTVKKYEVTKDAASMMALGASLSGSSRFVPEGHYTGLFRAGGCFGDMIIMSDTPDELTDLKEILAYSGHVLVAGLGLGCVIGYALEHTNIEKITVVEKSPDVIALTAKYWKDKFGDRLEVVHADIWTYETDQKFQHAWFDIWDDICEDNLTAFRKMEAKFKPNIEGNMGFWGEAAIKRQFARRHPSRCMICGEDEEWCECNLCNDCGWSSDDCECGEDDEAEEKHGAKEVFVEVLVDGCRKCGKRTFGNICAKCKGE